MADALYEEFRNGMLGGGTHNQPDLTANDIRVGLRDEGVTAVNLATQVDAADVSSAWVGSHTALTGLTVGSVGVGVFDHDDETYSSLSGATVESLDYFDYESAAEGTSPLIANLDSWTGLPLTPNGGDVILAPDTDGVFRFSVPTLFIPGYQGNPSVGMFTSKVTKEGYDAYTGGDISSGTETISQKIIDGIIIDGTADVTIEDCYITNRVTIDDDAVVYMTDCLFEVYDFYGILMPNDGAILTLEDSTFAESDSGGFLSSFAIGAVQGKSDSERSTVTRCQVTGGYEDGCVPWGNVTVTMLEIVEGALYYEATAHCDGVNTAASNVTVQYCNLNARQSDGDPAGTAALSIFGDFGNADNIKVDNCFFEWGNWQININEKANTLTGLEFTNNIFGANYGSGLAAATVAGGFDVWTGNVDHLGNPVSEPS